MRILAFLIAAAVVTLSSPASASAIDPARAIYEAPGPRQGERLTDFYAVKIVKTHSRVDLNCVDPAMLAVARRAARHFGKRAVHINSGHRTRAYNEQLRRRSKRVAKDSQHIKCKAIDFSIRGVSARRLAQWVAGQPEVGGIGVYRGRSFIHIDSRVAKDDWGIDVASYRPAGSRSRAARSNTTRDRAAAPARAVVRLGGAFSTASLPINTGRV